MFVLNNFTILCIVILILYFYKKNEMGFMLTVLLSSYCWMPVPKLGSFSLNSSYILTLLLVLLIIYEIFQKKFTLRRLQSTYLLIMLASIGVSMLGWLVNGNPKPQDILHFAGMSQYIVAAVGVSYFINKLNDYAEVKLVFYTFIKIGLIINLVFLIIQFMNPEFGYYLTKQLYVYGDRAAPLNEMAYWGKFTRGFGSNFAPYLLGIFSLMSAGFIMSDIIQSSNKLLFKSILIFTAVSLGILAFSKIIILGIFIIYAFYIFQEIFYKKSNVLAKVKPISIIGLSIILSFGFVAFVGNYIGLKGQVNYYYSMLKNPLQAISSRIHIESEASSESHQENSDHVDKQNGADGAQHSKEEKTDMNPSTSSIEDEKPEGIGSTANFENRNYSTYIVMSNKSSNIANIVGLNQNKFDGKGAINRVEESIGSDSNNGLSNTNTQVNKNRMIEKYEQSQLVANKQENSEKKKADGEDKKLTGSTAGALEVFFKHPIIGVGPAPIQGEFIGDSQIVSVLHDGGIINALLYLVFYGGIFIYYCMKKKNIQCMIILCLFLGCIAIPVFVYSITIPFMSLCLINNKSVKNNSYQINNI